MEKERESQVLSVRVYDRWESVADLLSSRLIQDALVIRNLPVFPRVAFNFLREIGHQKLTFESAYPDFNEVTPFICRNWVNPYDFDHHEKPAR